MKTKALLVLSTFMAVAFIATPIKAAGTIDQQQTATDGTELLASTAQSICQTFTSGTTGYLEQVALWMSTSYNEQAPATVSILGTVAGSPNSSVVLWSGSFSNLAQGWFYVDTAVSAPLLTAGQVYGLELQSSALVTGTTNLDKWYATGYYPATDAYSGGGLYTNTGSGWNPVLSKSSTATVDAAFITYMQQVPEPGTLGIVLSGLGMLVLFQRRRRRHIFA